MIAVGIDVAEERKGLDLVAIDRARAVVASAGRLSVDDVARLVLDELSPAVVCIDAPSGWSLSGRSRSGERALRALGITAFSTGADPGPHPFYRWVRVGFSIFESIAHSFPLYRGGSVAGHAAEVFPEASAVLLEGRLRGAEESKGHFRRAVLDGAGVASGALPNLDRVDAALAALTGLLALEGSATGLGDPGEGLIVVPVPKLPAERLRRRGGFAPAGP